MKFCLKVLFTLTFVLFIASPSVAQDLLARQVPIDHKLKSIDSLTVRRMLEGERFGNPAAALYGNWNERFVRNDQSVPDSFNIVLTNFCMPTTSHIVTSDFGLRRGRQHKGVDIKVYTGDTIRAAFSGKVRIVRYDERGYGNYIVISEIEFFQKDQESTLANLKALAKEADVIFTATPQGFLASVLDDEILDAVCDIL